MVIRAVTGPPCGGKSTYASGLGGGVVISSGRLIPHDPVISEILAAGGMYPNDSYVTDLVLKELERVLGALTSPVILDGFPRCSSQLRDLHQWCSNNGYQLDLHVLIVPMVLCRERAKRSNRYEGHDHRSMLWYAVQFHELIKTAYNLGLQWKSVFDSGEKVITVGGIKNG